MKKILCHAGLWLAFFVPAARAAEIDSPQKFSAASSTNGGTGSEVNVGTNKSVMLENSVGVKRLSVANSEIAEAVAVSKTEVMVNGKAPGETTLFLWDLNGERTMFDVHVQTPNARPDNTLRELQRELPGQDVSFTMSDGNVFLRGTVNDAIAGDRAAAIASTLGKVVNLLNVKVPEADPQILLKVRFANVERTALSQLGLNLVSTGATNTFGALSTGQFGNQPTFDFTQNPVKTSFNDLLNVFFFRPDLNLGGTIQALETKHLIQILAEPNLLAISGKPASFLAGGEFPFPTLQGGGAGVGQITIQFREFGIRIHFLPVVTPRGSIRLSVTPEVSSLDYANGLTIGGYTIPGLASRRVQTEVELENGQSFAIAGLMDNRVTETLSKIPGLSSIPLLGKLFESRLLQKNNTELLVVVTPILVQPIASGSKLPSVPMPKKPLKESSSAAPQNPVTPTAKLPRVTVIPYEVVKGATEVPAPSSSDVSPASLKPLLQLTQPMLNSQPSAPPRN